MQECSPPGECTASIDKRVHKIGSLEFLVMRLRAGGYVAYILLISELTPTEGTTTTTSHAPTSSTSAADNTGDSVPVVEIIIIAFGLLLLLFVAFRMASLVRRQGSTNPNSAGMFFKTFSRSLLDLDTVDCAVCSARQGVPRAANVFVCCSCHSANFIQRENGRLVRNFSPSPRSSGKRVSLHKVTDTFFKVDDGSQSALQSPKTEIASAADPAIPVQPAEGSSPIPALIVDSGSKGPGEGDALLCTVCMDAPADTVMMPCAHGGICYNCADALIRKHLLIGGAKCIHCRSSIDSLVKLSEMDKDVAQGVEIEIPKAMIVIRRNR